MREIKFRAWDNVKNKMYFSGIEDEVVFSFESCGLIATDLTEHDWGFKKLEHLIYMQYTGLKDKDGKEIYESDLTEDNVGIGFVEFTDGAYRVNYRNGTCKWFIDFLDSEKKVLEVISNIYEQGAKS